MDDDSFDSLDRNQILTTSFRVSKISLQIIHCLTIRCEFLGLAHKYTEFGVHISWMSCMTHRKNFVPFHQNARIFSVFRIFFRISDKRLLWDEPECWQFLEFFRSESDNLNLKFSSNIKKTWNTYLNDK